MPTLTLEDDITYFYEDSGAVPGEVYTTLVFVHGLGFNGGVFKKLFPLASSNKLRIVSIYRRNYPQTSAFTTSDFEDMSKPDDTFLRKQGLEITKFLLAYARNEKIPPVQQELGTGGIILAGWSLGTVHAVSVLAYLSELPKPMLETLGQYLHTVVLHDTAAFLLGIPNPPNYDVSFIMHPAAETRFQRFKEWVTGYYAHKDHLSPSQDSDDLEFDNRSDKPLSLHDISAEERTSITCFDAFNGSDFVILGTAPEVYKGITKRALFDKKLASECLPNLRVRLLTSGESPGIIIWGLWEFRRYLEDPTLLAADAEKARDVKTMCPAEGNHFVFWDDPELAIRQFTECINL
ncbi:hypothetical protein BJ138DRAFT_670150 [Hygrophoropsis aurantiaca]|uniref:Uncharacterized protein n=1 Tax=Hygrophoropsis aurantiaca TaxID=72124 RepID=A0ACB8AIU7_9AGAM|nr:hypothetical protein BJ138DRAFT_670150 [Hygrophoropsis aurantiaca]